VVEDDPGLRRLLARSMKREGFRIAEAGTAEEACAWLKKAAADIILLDLHLPDAEGAELFRRIKKHAADAGIVVVTGFGGTEEAVQVMKMGAQDFLLKSPHFLENVPVVTRRALKDLEAERKVSAAEGALREQAERQATLASFGVLAISLVDVQQLLDEANRLIVGVVDVEFAKVQEVTADRKFLRLRSGVGWTEEEMGRSLVSAGRETPGGLALQSGKPVVVENLSEDARFTPPDLLRNHGIKSGVTVVIHGPKEPFGVLGMHSRDGRSYREIDIDFLQSMANVVAAALQRTAADDALGREQEFTSTLIDTTEALVVTLDANWRIWGFNKACRKLTGYSWQEVKGRPALDFLVPAEEREAVLKAGEKMLRGEGPISFESHWVIRNGERRPISWSGSLVIVRSTSGQIASVIVTGIDVTEKRALARELLDVSEREQARLGRDLHDDLCQYLAGMRMMADRLGQALHARGLPDLGGDARGLVDNLDEALTRTRLLAHGLSPVTDAGGLPQLFQDLCAYTKKAFHVECKCSLPSEVATIDGQVGVHVFRITQEALQNAVRHGHAQKIDVQIVFGDGHFVLRVSDDGQGFKRGDSPGMGIRSMQHRARLFDGKLNISSRPGEGTQVTCTVPVRKPQ